MNLKTKSGSPEWVVLLAGNPNSGKSSLFNWLAGAHQHVGNYPGVTVEKKSARFVRAGIRIDDFAQIAGVSKQFMTDLENGKDTVRMGMVLSLLQRMSVHVSLDLPDSAVDLYNAELEKVTRRRTTKKAPEG